MSPEAVYPDEAIQAHLAFLARRRALRPSEEYRVPTDDEWTEFLGHFERRKVSTGICGRAFGTPCIHEHACVRCPMLWPDPAQRERLVEIRDNLTARIAEAQREGWLGDVEGLQISLDGANHKLAQVERHAPHPAVVDLGVPALTIRLDRPVDRQPEDEDQVQRMRNLALSRHRIAGATNIAAASRHVGRHPNRVLPLLT